MTTNPTLMGDAPELIAHRGYSGRYPENTLVAFEAAYEQGARYMELDLQLTADKVPVLHHDLSLERMANVDMDIRDTPVKKLKTIKAAYSLRFGSEFEHNEFTTFRRYCQWLATHKEVTTFVEIKQESIERHGPNTVIDKVIECIIKAGVAHRCVIISFNVEALKYTRKVSLMRTGWVLPAWNDEQRKTLESLTPDYLFCNINLLPLHQEAVWQGHWQLAIYNVDDVNLAIDMANRGIHLLETNQIGTLMNDAALKSQ